MNEITITRFILIETVDRESFPCGVFKTKDEAAKAMKDNLYNHLNAASPEPEDQESLEEMWAELEESVAKTGAFSGDLDGCSVGIDSTRAWSDVDYGYPCDWIICEINIPV